MSPLPQLLPGWWEGRRNLGTLWLCYGSMTCLAAASNLPPVYLTTFSETFGGLSGLSEEQLGRIPAVLFAALVFGIVLSGPLADRLGAKIFLVAGLACTSLGFVVLAGAVNYPMLLGAVALLGLGSGVLDTLLSPIVSALRPERRVSSMNWLHSFYCSGAVCTVLVGSAALKLHVSWRIVSLVLAAVPAVFAFGFSCAGTPPLLGVEEDRKRLRVLVRDTSFLAVLLVISMAGATEVSMAQWLPAFAERGLGYSKATGGMALAGFSFAMLAGRILIAAVGHRLKPIPLMTAFCTASASLYTIGCFLPHAPIALLACILVGFSSSCLWPTTLSLTADRFPNGGASMFGLLAAAGNGGCVVMPWLVGAIAEQSRIHYGLASVTFCPVLMIILLLRIRSARG